MTEIGNKAIIRPNLFWVSDTASKLYLFNGSTKYVCYMSVVFFSEVTPLEAILCKRLTNLNFEMRKNERFPKLARRHLAATARICKTSDSD